MYMIVNQFESKQVREAHFAESKEKFLLEKHKSMTESTIKSSKQEEGKRSIESNASQGKINELTVRQIIELLLLIKYLPVQQQQQHYHGFSGVGSHYYHGSGRNFDAATPATHP